MKRALILNSGASWAAYQIGALRHLVVDRAMHFELLAGTGIGAMNAALVACGEFSALEAFWERIGIGSLVAFNWRTPWREGPCTGTPQRRFIAAHVSEKKLAEYGVTLLVSTLNLQTGQEQVMTYPGSDLPLVDALMAAVATPGFCRPITYRGQQLAEGTLINSFLLHTVLQHPIEEIIAVAVATPLCDTSRRYTTWRAVLERALAINQAHDVWAALADGEKVTSAATAFRHVTEQLPARLAERITDPVLQEQLLTRVSEIYSNSAYLLKRTSGPVVKAITPSHELPYPLWRFRPTELAAAKALGYRDATNAMKMEDSQ